MKKYRDLKEYIEDKWYELIFNSSSNFIKKNFSNEDIATDRVPYPFIRWVDNVKITSLYTKDCDSTVEIYTTVRARLVFKGRAYGKSKNDVEEDEKYLYLQLIIKVPFTSEFGEPIIKSIEISDQKKPFNIKEASTGAFIPYMKEELLDFYAEKFLSYTYPVALERAIPLNIEEILSVLGLNVLEKPLPSGIFGKLYFTYNKMENIKKGTILLDPDQGYIRGEGNINNTIIHECVHCFFHKRYFDLMRILDEQANSITCATIENESKINDINQNDYKWLEWQANSLAPRILMPKKTFLEKYNEILKKNLELLSGYELLSLQLTIRELSDFFKVSVESTKIRLRQLGVDKVAGIFEYVDGKEVRRHKASGYQLGKNETFIIGFKDALILSYTNETLIPLIKEEKIVYVENFFVINDSRYINFSKKGPRTLTEYAVNHMDECCLIFEIENMKINHEQNNAFSLNFISKKERKKFIKSEFNADNTNNLSVIFEAINLNDVINEEKEIEKFLEEHKNDDFTKFYNALEERCGLYECTDAYISEITKLDPKTIANYRNGKTAAPTNIRDVLAVIAGFCLQPKIAKHLIYICGLSLGRLSLEHKLMYEFLINNCYDQGIDYWNEKIEEIDPNAKIPERLNKKNKE